MDCDSDRTDSQPGVGLGQGRGAVGILLWGLKA